MTLNLGAIGFGCMKSSWPEFAHSDNASAREEVITALQHALDNGVRLLDTADIYAPAWNAFGHNEKLVAEAVQTWDNPAKSEVVIATKAGITRGPGESWGRSASTDYLLRAVEASAGRMQVAEIPLWQHHRLDPSMRLLDQLAGLKAVQEQGIVKHIGVSNYSAEQLRIAVNELGGPKDGGIVSIQNQLNPQYRVQLDVLDVCDELGIWYLPWSPLAGARPQDAGSPSFEAFVDVATRHKETVQTVALAWLRTLSPWVVPIPGVTKLSSVKTSLRALHIQLSDEDLADLRVKLPDTLPIDPDVDFTLPI
jgi:aryl-alcohol dehydrogenase-like predicted oxidoreductase